MMVGSVAACHDVFSGEVYRHPILTNTHKEPWWMELASTHPELRSNKISEAGGASRGGGFRLWSTTSYCCFACTVRGRFGDRLFAFCPSAGGPLCILRPCRASPCGLAKE